MRPAEPLYPDVHDHASLTIGGKTLSVGNKPGALVYGSSHLFYRFAVAVIEAV